MSLGTLIDKKFLSPALINKEKGGQVNEKVLG